MDRKVITRNQFEAIQFLCVSIYSAALQQKGGGEISQALFTIVKNGHHNILVDAGLSLDEFFQFCKDNRNYVGVLFGSDLPNWKDRFMEAVRLEQNLRDAISLYSHGTN